MDMNKDTIDVLNAIYKIGTNDEEDITRIYQDIEKKIIDALIYSPKQILKMISVAPKYKNKYFCSYYEIYKKIFQKYHPIKINEIPVVFLSFFVKDCVIALNDINIK